MIGSAGNALGFDVGERWVGVALGSPSTGSARPLRVLQRDHSRFWSELAALIGDWQPQILIVGEPLNLDGSEQPATLLARRFARQLEGRMRLPVRLIDERHSSREADQRFADQRRQGLRRRRDAELQDALAAAVILERWLQAGAPTDSSPPSPTAHDAPSVDT